jgi:hypothetical protein
MKKVVGVFVHFFRAPLQPMERRKPKVPVGFNFRMDRYHAKQCGSREHAGYDYIG